MGGGKPTPLCSTHSESGADQSQSLHGNGPGGTRGQVPSEWWALGFHAVGELERILSLPAEEAEALGSDVPPA